ncbi:hypothetical protein IWW34DRAFT_690207 [Fusarium oxysporum f. sp. albedinis]|nr:hypothetical protein IWW34DRAFT_690207 [Fusarium oxysporum f. sp. albedinis]KAK2484638.1 hypothetical protein H9L39_02618 [Fusarium oxysporum f. sp. albedinis]
MTTFDAETFAFLSSIKEPALDDGATRTRLLDMMENLEAPHPYGILQWLQMAEFRAFAFDNLRVDCVKTWAGYKTKVHPLWIFLLLGRFIATMLGQENLECTVGGNRYQCPRPEEEKMELEYRSNKKFRSSQYMLLIIITRSSRGDFSSLSSRNGEMQRRGRLVVHLPTVQV